ncbi:hypothetical protein MMC13_000976 [Lambiella insularis]|nr:hypothetical protein [Lambiella insularis]
MSSAPVSFLSLPREVRDLCYSHLLSSRAAQPLKSSQDKYLSHVPSGFAYTFPTTVFLLNRRISFEASLVIYGRNPFIIDLDHFDIAPRRTPVLREATSRDIRTLAESSSRRSLVKTFTLRFAVPCLWVEGREGLDLYSGGRVVRPLLDKAISLIHRGPLLDNLRVLLRFSNTGAANSSKKKCSSDLTESLSGLAHRVRKVEVDYVLLHPMRLSPYIAGNHVHLEELRQMLQYHPSRRVSLLGLPRECRDIIYSSLLSEKPNKTPNLVAWTPISKTFSTALLRTCHQINEEATSVFYSNTRLSILVGLSSARMVIATVPPQYRHLVKHYEIAIIERYDSPPTYGKVHDVCQELRARPKIKSIEIQIEVAMAPWYGREAYNFVDGFAPLNEHVDEIRIGILRRTSYSSSSLPSRPHGPDDECYRRLKGVLPGPAKWTFPYPYYQFKD